MSELEVCCYFSPQSAVSCCIAQDDTNVLVRVALEFTDCTVVALFQGSARESIEELRTSMSELKLPAEMDFKYK